MVKNLPSNGGDVDLIPGLRTRISYATEQLSPRVATTEPASYNERSCMLQGRSHLPQLRLDTAKNKYEYFKKYKL